MSFQMVRENCSKLHKRLDLTMVLREGTQKEDEHMDAFNPQKSSFITIEGIQEEFRAREILKVQSRESYRTDIQSYQVGY